MNQKTDRVIRRDIATTVRSSADLIVVLDFIIEHAKGKQGRPEASLGAVFNAKKLRSKITDHPDHWEIVRDTMELMRATLGLDWDEIERAVNNSKQAKNAKARRKKKLSTIATEAAIRKGYSCEDALSRFSQESFRIADIRVWRDWDNLYFQDEDEVKPHQRLAVNSFKTKFSALKKKIGDTG